MAVALTKYDIVLHEQQHEREEERKIRLKALITTIAIYVVLFILIFFLVVPAQNPPLKSFEGGNGPAIILGNDAIGMGETYELVAAGPPFDKITAPKVNPVTPPPPQQQQVSEDQFEDSNDPDAVAINKTPKPKKDNTPVTKPTDNQAKTTTTTTTPQREVDRRTLFEKGGGSGGTGGTNTSKGTGNTAGDQGDRNGSPNGGWQNGNGGDGTGTGNGKGNGNGPGFSLSGRSAISLPQPEGVTNQSGVVVVAIEVDREGNVISVRGGVRGSTTTNAALIAKAEYAARRAKFSTNVDGPEIQSGTIRYNFLLQ